MRRLPAVLALISALLGGALIWRGMTRPWEPQAGFDVLGILWLLTNLPNVFLVITGGLLLIAALALVVYAVRRRSAQADEAARMLADPRFHGILADEVRARRDEVEGERP